MNSTPDSYWMWKCRENEHILKKIYLYMHLDKSTYYKNAVSTSYSFQIGTDSTKAFFRYFIHLEGIDWLVKNKNLSHFAGFQNLALRLCYMINLYQQRKADVNSVAQ